ncbi:MAG: SPOR domain-containing protein [Marinifilaceae bacterium]
MTSKKLQSISTVFRHGDARDIGRIAAGVWMLLLLSTGFCSAQGEPDFDEISIFLNVNRIGGIEVPVAIREDLAFLSVTDVFDFLRIKNNPSPGFETVEGFFIDEQAKYVIDQGNSHILYNGKEYQLSPKEMIRTEMGLYLKSSLYGEVFGLDCHFNFRSLSVTMKPSVQLPMIREKEQEEMRNNINRLKGEVKADTTILRSYPLFDLGMADWSVISTQQEEGQCNTKVNLGLGAMFAGGETNVGLNYASDQAFSLRQQHYLWRFVNNESRGVRQILGGKIFSQATSTITAPVVGMQVTNTPTTYRRSFGTYPLSDFTEPGWLVELYVNNVLVDFQKADASGFFTFEVPLVYGNSSITLRFYGPWGEERTSERNISIPLNFLPKNELEYTIRMGMVEDGSNSRFSRVNFNYGLGPRWTLGGGVEYLSSVSSSPVMPFLTLGMRLAPGLLFSGEYTHKVRSKGILTWQGPSSLLLELDYTRYAKGQMAISTNYLEERKVRLSMPLRNRYFSAFSRFTLSHVTLPGSRHTLAEMLFSGSLQGVNTNFTTNAISSLTMPLSVNSTLSLAFTLPGRILFRPRLRYSYDSNELLSLRCGVEKRLFGRGFLNFSCAQDFRTNSTSAEIGFRYDFSFARSAFSARRTNKRNTFVQSASGSLMYDSKTKYLGKSNRRSVGKGGITFMPFLDLNSNGSREKNEPKVSGLKLRVKGGRIVRDERDSTIHLIELEPYRNYRVELDPNCLDNIAWKIRKPILSIAVDPNKFKLVEVPVAVMGEVSGMVYQEKKGESEGQGRIIVKFYNENKKLVARTLSEEDGYFNFLGLMPGNYTACLDSAQLQKLQMFASPAVSPFTINSNTYGDVVDGLEFTLRSNRNQNQDLKEDVEEIKVDSIPMPAIADLGLFSIQVATFKKLDNALQTQERLRAGLNRPVVLVFDEGVYHVRMTGLDGKRQVEQCLSEIVEVGFQDAYPVRVAEFEQEVILANQQKSRKNLLISSRGIYAIQVGVFRNQGNALRTKAELGKVFEKPVVIVFEDGLYKVRLTGFKGYSRANEFLPKVLKEGYWDAFLLLVPRNLSF